jgi:hypothetical protein
MSWYYALLVEAQSHSAAGKGHQNCFKADHCKQAILSSVTGEQGGSSSYACRAIEQAQPFVQPNTTFGPADAIIEQFPDSPKQNKNEKGMALGRNLLLTKNPHAAVSISPKTHQKSGLHTSAKGLNNWGLGIAVSPLSSARSIKSDPNTLNLR